MSALLRLDSSTPTTATTTAPAAAAGAARVGESVEQLLERAQTLNNRAGEIANVVRITGEQSTVVQAYARALDELIDIHRTFSGIQNQICAAAGVTQANRVAMVDYESSINGFIVLVDLLYTNGYSTLPSEEQLPQVEQTAAVTVPNLELIIATAAAPAAPRPAAATSTALATSSSTSTVIHP